LLDVLCRERFDRSVEAPSGLENSANRYRERLQAFAQLVELAFVGDADTTGTAHRFLEFGLASYQPKSFGQRFHDYLLERVESLLERRGFFCARF
jgi:hypothetical protein